MAEVAPNSVNGVGPPTFRPFRVALVTGSYNYIADGVALTLNRLVGHLTSRGVDVLVFAPVGKAPAFAHMGEVVPVASISAPGRAEYRVALGLSASARKRILDFKPDLLHIATPDLLGHDALKLGRAMGWPTVASYHTRFETYLKYYGLEIFAPVLTGVVRRFYDSCLEVYVPSPSMVEALRADGVKGNLQIWPRGVDTRRFHPDKRSLAWRDVRRIRPDEVVVAFVSRLVKEKRVAEVVDVLSRLRAAGIPHRPLFVGDGPERSFLESEVPGALFEGFLSGDALPIAYASSDVFFFPSDTETFGNVTLEAMASGLPSVCANATGSRSLVDPGVTGFLANVGDSEALYTSVARLVTNAELRLKMGQAARLRSLSYSWDAAMDGILAHYMAILSL